MSSSTGAVASTFGPPAWVASALVHGALAAVIAVQAGKPGPSSTRTIDVEPSIVELAPPDPTPPPPPAIPETLPIVTPPPPLAPLPPSPAKVAARAATAEPTKDVQPVAASEPQANASPVVTAAAPSGPTFVMALPLGTSSTATVAKAQDEVVDERGVTARAEVAFGPTPVYPAAARAAEIETDVPVELVVDATGRVLSARVTRHVGYGLDEATLDAIKRYRFSPAQRDGRAVAVRMLWTMQFRLQ